MNIHDQAYANSDIEYGEICEFLDALSAIEPNMLWESGRMGFWRHSVHASKPQDDPFFRDNVHVWRTEEDEIVALCISEYGRNDLFIEVHPKHHDLYPAILDWVEDVWATNRENAEIEIFAEDSVKIAQFEARGFAFSSHFENTRSYDLNQLKLKVKLEEGFSIQTLAESGDMEGRVALTQNAFDNPSYTVERPKGLVSSPDHRDEYNLMAVSPDGQPVAYCVGWHENARGGYGYIEPVGTHTDFRQRGFAKAVITECFSRLKANGIRFVEIASHAEPDVSNFLYESLSPTSKREVHKYGKQVKPT